MYIYPFKIFTPSKEKRILKDNGSYGGIYDAVKDNYINTRERAKSIGAKVSILLGEVVNGVKLICLDLDDCFMEDGSIEPETKELLKEFNNNEWEVSSSGEGIHVYILTKLDLETFIVKDLEGCKSFECYTNKRHIVTTTFDFLETNLFVGAHDNFIKTLYDKVKQIHEAKNPYSFKDTVIAMFNGREIKEDTEIYSDIYDRKPVTDMYTLRGCGFKDSALIELIDTEPSTVDQSAHDAALIRKLMYYTFSFEGAWELAKKTNYYKHKDAYHQKKFNDDKYKERTRKFLRGD